MLLYDEMLKKAPERLKRPVTWQTAGTKALGKLVVGCGVAKTAGEEARRLGKPRALLVTDSTLSGLQLVDVVLEALESSGVSADVFSRVEAEPRIELAGEAGEMARTHEYGTVVALGGGSVIDTAKAAAMLATNPGEIFDYIGGKGFESPGLPRIAIPTTSGTGSEVSNSFVFSKDGRKVFSADALLFPDVALIDPIMTATMPPRVTAGTGLDALCHAVEGLVHPKAYPIGDALSCKAIEFVFNYLPRATRDGSDIEARYHMSWASSLGMMSYNWTGGLYAHSVSYVLTHHLGMGHGMGCGISLPYTLMLNIDYIREKLVYMGRVLGIPGDASSLPERAIQRSWELLREVNLPQSLQEAGVERQSLKSYAEETMEQYYRPFNPREVGLPQLERLFENMWEGSLKPVE